MIVTADSKLMNGLGCYVDLGGKYSRHIPYTLELLGDMVCTHEELCDLRAFAYGELLVADGETVTCSCSADRRSTQDLQRGSPLLENLPIGIHQEPAWRI